jgi:diacylglycerol kinase family enzyme
LVVTNFSAGARPREESIRGLLMRLKQEGLAAEVITDLAVFDTLVTRYQAAGQLRAVVAAGGDGTVAEIVNRTAPDVPVTVYPLGTANLLAGYVQLSNDPAALARTLVEGATLRLDAGRANGRIFLLMAGCGFDADVVERLHRRRDGRNITYWTWAKPIWESVRSYAYPDLRVTCELASGDELTAFDYRARWVFAVNLPCYAGGLEVAPEATGTDGLLNMATFGNGSFWHALRYVGLVALGWHRNLSDYRAALVTRVHIESSDPVPYQLDGDPGGLLPLDIEILPERFTLMAPAARLAALDTSRAPLQAEALS